MSKKGGFMELLYSDIMPKVYGIGAAIVIVGAMFKILHLPGAAEMLGVGLTTEAVIFFLSAFEPKHKDPDWTKVYPELADDYDGPVGHKKIASGSNMAAQLDMSLEKAKMGPELFESLSKGMSNLAESAKKMANLSDAAVATNDYATNVKSASKSLVEMNKSYGETLKAMGEMANISKDTKEYHTQVVNVTKSLGALNAVYEMELKDAQGHVKAISKFYGSVGAAMENIAQAGKDSEVFKAELSKLTTNVTSLNKIYGNMLAAMKG